MAICGPKFTHFLGDVGDLYSLKIFFLVCLLRFVAKTFMLKSFQCNQRVGRKKPQLSVHQSYQILTEYIAFAV